MVVTDHMRILPHTRTARTRMHGAKDLPHMRMGAYTRMGAHTRMGTRTRIWATAGQHMILKKIVV